MAPLPTNVIGTLIAPLASVVTFVTPPHVHTNQTGGPQRQISTSANAIGRIAVPPVAGFVLV